MANYKAIKDYKGLCWNCLKTDEGTKEIKIPELGYGSGFDGFSTEIHLCPECYEKTKNLWGLQIKSVNEYCEEYENEDEIIAFFNKLPPEGQQFVYNEFDTGIFAHIFPPQIWMDYFVNKNLPHEVAKEYGLYSFEEQDAYKERFPKCKWPVNIVYPDGSKGCRCPFGAFGNKGQEVSENISTKCYKCPFYEERVEPIKEVQYKNFDKYTITAKYENLDKI